MCTFLEFVQRPMQSSGVLSLCGATFLLTINGAHADPLATLNALRAEGCADAIPANSDLAPSEPLNGVARELAVDGQLSGALERTGYPAASSVAVYMKVGIYRSGDEMWIVLAAPMDLPAVADAATVATHVLELVNAARANARQCGDRQFAAVPPLTLSSVLTDVALAHAQDMARQRVMDHRGSDGSQPSERVARAGYNWQATGENVAAGQPDADTVVAGWLDSPGHCVNIMAPQFTEMGVAFALTKGNPPIYWAQVFAAPR
jgi:uncharacterized protein YkwD